MVAHQDLRNNLMARAASRCECTLCESHNPGRCGHNLEHGRLHCILPGSGQSLGTMELLCEACYRSAVEFDDRYWAVVRMPVPVSGGQELT
jgi:hypothetical protein